MHWYLVPLDRKGNLRGPRYLKWRGDPSGIDAPWSLMDFGDIDLAVVAASVDATQHAELTAHDDCHAIGEEVTAGAVAMLQIHGVETNTLEGALLADQRHRLLALAQAYQALQAQEAQLAAAMRMAAPVDVGAMARAWAGTPIHFGIAGTVTDGASGD